MKLYIKIKNKYQEVLTTHQVVDILTISRQAIAQSKFLMEVGTISGLNLYLKKDIYKYGKNYNPRIPKSYLTRTKLKKLLNSLNN